MNEISFPLAARPWWLVGIFTFWLGLFHFWLVWGIKLGKVGWKRVDYVWLGVAALGLFGTSTEVRRLFASTALEARTNERNSAYRDLRHEVGFLTGLAVCRRFVASDLSPPSLKALQREYDEVCTFARGLLQELPTEAPEKLPRERFERRPPVSDPILSRFFDALEDRYAHYLRAHERLVATMAAAQRSQGELAFTMIAPFLLAVALALRITKVTGELRLEA